MKKIISIVLALIACTTVSNAQLVKSRTYADLQQKGYSDYNRLTVGYNGLFLSSEGESTTLHGVEIMYDRGFSLSESIPVYLDLGLSASYNTKEEASLMRFMVPVSVSYKWFANDVFALQPYTGINFKANVNIDNADDVKVFQMGWQIGLGFNIKKFYLGIEYCLDFLPMYKEKYYNISINSSNIAARIGITF